MPTQEEFEFEWKSTAEERYHTNMLTLAKGVFASNGLVVTEEWGGTAFGDFGDDYLASDNGFAAVTSLGKAAEVGAAIANAVGHSVKITSRSEEP